MDRKTQNKTKYYLCIDCASHFFLQPPACSSPELLGCILSTENGLRMPDVEVLAPRSLRDRVQQKLREARVPLPTNNRDALGKQLGQHHGILIPWVLP